MASDTSFLSSMYDFGVSVPSSPTENILGKSPTDWVWHHDIGNGVMQLVPKTQHTTGNVFLVQCTFMELVEWQYGDDRMNKYEIDNVNI